MKHSNVKNNQNFILFTECRAAAACTAAAAAGLSIFLGFYVFASSQNKSDADR